jgi:hypothetical protein
MQMTLKRFVEMVAAYGADDRRWPEAEREAGRHLASASLDARRALEEARTLDRLLDAVDAPAPSAEFGARLADCLAAPPAASRFVFWLWLGPVWRPAVAAAVAVFGLCLGLETERLSAFSVEDRDMAGWVSGADDLDDMLEID